MRTDAREAVVKIGVACWSFDALKSAGVLKTPVDYLTKVREYGFDGIMLDASFLHDLKDVAKTRELRRRADDMGLFIHFGMGREFDSAGRGGADAVVYFRTARLLGSPCIKVGLQNPFVRFKEQWTAEDALRNVDGAIERLTGLERLARAHDMPVAFENHVDFTTEEVGRILGVVDSAFVGLCFDPANQLVLMEDPLDLCRKYRDRILTTHIKDAFFTRAGAGARVSWAVPGRGLIGLPDIMSELLRDGREIPLHMELIASHALEVPFHEDAFWRALQKDRDGNQVLRRIEAHLQDASACPPLDTAELLRYEDRMLREGCDALKCTAEGGVRCDA